MLHQLTWLKYKEQIRNDCHSILRNRNTIENIKNMAITKNNMINAEQK